ncbi:hypothetical protein ACHAXT_002619 [Thalassiosira profunda]
MADRQQKLRALHARRAAAAGSRPTTASAASARSLFARGTSATNQTQSAPASEGKAVITAGQRQKPAGGAGTEGADKNGSRGGDKHKNKEGGDAGQREVPSGAQPSAHETTTSSQTAAFAASQRGSAAPGAAGGGAQDRMKQLFAARRRKAQLEMAKAAVPGANSSLNASLADSASVSSGATATSEEGGATSVATLATAGSSYSGASSKASNGPIAHSSRRALDRYLGKSKSHGAGGASISSGMSGSGMSGGSGIAGGSSAVGGSSAATSGASLGSGATSGKSATSHIEQRDMQRGASASSMSTAVVDNTTEKADSGTTAGRDNASAKAESAASHRSTKGSEPSRPEENLGDKKSVRFHLSPLERQTRRGLTHGRNAQTNQQCSPPRKESEEGSTSEGRRGKKGVPLDSSTGKGCDRTNRARRDNAVPEGAAPEDAEFTRFVAGLRREVAGDHTELWAGFQSLLGRPASALVPLDPSSAGATVDGEGTDGSAKKKKKKVRMDPATQQSLTRIHRSLMERGRVKGKFVTTTCQLDNDRKVRRGRAKEERAGADEGDAKPRTGEKGVYQFPREAQGEEAPEPRPGSKPEAWRNRLRRTPTKARSPLESTPTRGGRPLANVQLRSVGKANSSESSQRDVASPRANVKQRRSDGERGQPSVGNGEAEAAPKGTPGWMEALKQKQKGLRLQPREGGAQEERGHQGSGALAGASVALRRASPRKKPRTNAPPASPAARTAAPWSRAQLRSAPKTRESMDPAGARSVHVPPSLPPVGAGNRAASSRSAPASPAAAGNPSLLPALGGAGDQIDLDNPPKHLFPDGAAAAFPLKQYPGRPAKLVLVGSEALLTATLTATLTQPRLAEVAWHCLKADVRALTLNVEATGANVAHARGRTPLLFETADVCLDFCRAFYRGPTSESDQATPTVGGSQTEEGANDGAASPKAEEAPKGPLESPATPDATGPTPSNLTEDEASLLDRYRQYDQSDRTKLRLTCLSPRGEMEEVEVSLSPPLKATPRPDGRPAPNEGGPVDEGAAAKFRKMLQMGVPSDAVRHKMTTEGVDAATVAAVLDEPNKPLAATSSANNGRGLAPEEEKAASKYRKMLKMGVPPDGVRHKMETEGADAQIIDAVFAPPSQEKNKAGVPSPLTGDEEVVASKYRRMLKMGVPVEGVEHKMKQDGVDARIILAVVVEAGSTSGGAADEAGANPPASHPSAKAAAAGPTLSEEDETIAKKYRNMLKVCIPKDAVRHKMKQEGVSDKVIEAVLGKDSNVANAVDTQRHLKANNRKTIAFHWTTSNLAPEQLEQSIFGRAELKKRKLASINPEEADIKKLEALFQKRNNGAKAKAGGGKEDAGNDMARLVDLTRANNVAISLKAFNDFTFRSLAEAIADLDPDCKIVGERVQFVPNLLPTPKEVLAVKKYKGDDDKLIAAELFFRQLVPIKRIEDKVKVLRTMSTFEEHIAEARAGFQTLQTVCAQVMNSEKLIQILDMVLNVGNLMNEGTLDGGVDAFKFESLPRLSQTKSADGKTTVLDYIVETFIEKGERRALLLLPEFPDIQEAGRLPIGDLVGDMDGLRAEYKLCKAELAGMKRDQSSKRVTRSMSKKMADEGEGGDPRKALFAAIQARGAGEEAAPKSPPKEEGGDPRQALFAAIKNRTTGASPDEEGDSPAKSNAKHTPGVHRLSKFLLHSRETLSLAGQDQDAAIRACKGLAVYCGEGGGERAAAPLLQVLSEFALSLENGIKRYDDRLAAEARKKKAAEKKREGEKGKENNGRNPAPTMASWKLSKASSFQPHVGLTANVNKQSLPFVGQEKADPMNELLNAIKGRGSQKEEASPRHASPKKVDPKQALLASIKNRRESLPVKPPLDGVPERIQHINKTLQRKESRVLLVNRMLSEAPASVRQDFLKGVTYEETSDPLLKKIYDKEDQSPRRDGGEDAEVAKIMKPVDPRQELFAAIRRRKELNRCCTRALLCSIASSGASLQSPNYEGVPILQPIHFFLTAHGSISMASRALGRLLAASTCPARHRHPPLMVSHREGRGSRALSAAAPARESDGGPPPPRRGAKSPHSKLLRVCSGRNANPHFASIEAEMLRLNWTEAMHSLVEDWTRKHRWDDLLELERNVRRYVQNNLTDLINYHPEAAGEWKNSPELQSVSLGEHLFRSIHFPHEAIVARAAHHALAGEGLLSQRRAEELGDDADKLAGAELSERTRVLAQAGRMLAAMARFDDDDDDDGLTSSAEEGDSAGSGWTLHHTACSDSFKRVVAGWFLLHRRQRELTESILARPAAADILDSAAKFDAHPEHEAHAWTTRWIDFCTAPQKGDGGTSVALRGGMTEADAPLLRGVARMLSLSENAKRRGRAMELERRVDGLFRYD